MPAGLIGLRVVVIVISIQGVVRIRVMRIVYTPIFSIPYVDVSGADFLIETPFRSDYILAYYIYSFACVV